MSLLDRLTDGTELTLYKAGSKVPATAAIGGRTWKDGDDDGTLVFWHVSFPLEDETETRELLPITVDDVTELQIVFDEATPFDSSDGSSGAEVRLVFWDFTVLGFALAYDLDGWIAIEVPRDETADDEQSNDDSVEVRLYKTRDIQNWAAVAKTFEALREAAYASPDSTGALTDDEIATKAATASTVLAEEPTDGSAPVDASLAGGDQGGASAVEGSQVGEGENQSSEDQTPPDYDSQLVDTGDEGQVNEAATGEDESQPDGDVSDSEAERVDKSADEGSQVADGEDQSSEDQTPPDYDSQLVDTGDEGQVNEDDTGGEESQLGGDTEDDNQSSAT